MQLPSVVGRLKVLISPFKENLWLWGTMTILGSIGIVYHVNSVRMMAYYCVLSSVISYVAVLIHSILPNCLNKAYEFFLIFLGCANVIVDVVSYETTGHLFYEDHVALILGTNYHESIDFFGSYITMRIIIICSVLIASGLIVAYVLKKYLTRRILCYLCPMLITAMVSVCLFTNVLKSRSWRFISFCKSALFAAYQEAPDLSEYRQTPTLQLSDASRIPSEIVFIIGESFSKSHSSLYGYQHETNPNLADTSLSILKFSSVKAAATHTIQAFKSMLSTYYAGMDEKWYKCLTLFDICKQAGYETIWLSNQAKNGAFDNVVSKYSDLADFQFFTGDESNFGLYKNDLDEMLLPMVDSCSKLSGKHMTIIHLMGSHLDYRNRYSDEYAKFDASNYVNLPDNQRSMIAAYDNSILYNDFVVSEIIKDYSLRDAVVIYCSDHGQDLYESDPFYVGHAKDSNPESVEAALAVPFLVSVPAHEGDGLDSIRSRLNVNRDKPYNLENIMYTIADLMGIESIDGEPIGDKSILCMSE